MEGVSPGLREQGMQALRDGEIDRAVDLLARCVISDSQDAEAQALLGVAYSQKGLHAQATRALETAIELRPQEVRYRFNLGVALEQASDWNGAANAYRRVLQANPEHPQARAKLQALGSKVQSAPVVATPRVGAGSPSAPPNAPWLAADTLAAGPVETGPPGTVQCAQCKQWSKPGLSCEWCSAPLRSTSAQGTGLYQERADNAARYQPERPVGITILVVLSYIGAAFMILGGLLMFLGAGAIGLGGAGMGGRGLAAGPGGFPMGAVAGIAGFLIVYAFGISIVSAYLWKGANWARITYIVIQSLGILMGVFQLLQGKNPLVTVLELLVNILFLVVLTGKAARDYCTS